MDNTNGNRPCPVAACIRASSAHEHRRARGLLAGVLALAFVAGSGVAFAQPLRYEKLDAPLSLFAGRPDAAVKLYQERVESSDGLLKSAATGALSVLIRLDPADEAATKATLDAVAATGTAVRSRLGPIVTATAPIASLNALAAIDGITLIELSRPMVSRLNVSVPATGATTLRAGTAPNWTGLTGKGVIVGVIDDGVDFRHLDFRKPNAGGTRLLALWDQRQQGAAGAAPQPYGYGGECTPAMMDDAIGGNAAACTQPSNGGHGTHVAGIAAGNGQATGNGQAAYRFAGMAPEADILSANAIANGASVLDAIAWMKGKAAAAAKPLVINMSFGSYYGPRDGTSNFEVGASAAGAAGVILVGAAGNEGDAPIRAEGPISQGGQVMFDLDVPAAATNGPVTVEAWYPGTDSYSVTVQGPTCQATAAFTTAAAVAPVETACGQIGVTNGGPFASNDDRQVQVVMRPGNSPLAAGTWKVTFLGATVNTPNTPVSIVTGEVGGGLTVLAINGTPFAGPTTKILTDAASAKRVIAVGAYVTNYTWTDSQGNPSNVDGSVGPLGDLATFSSRGPRRNCSNPAKCPAIMKPEIVAPGAYIMAAKAVDSTTGATSTERDGVHTAKIGTSMATPHVSGAIALMLQKKATLTPEDVKQLLFTNRKTTPLTPAIPTYTGADVPANPNFAWGYGVLDVAAAANAIVVQGGGLAVTVTKAGTGSGSVASNPAGITCGATCSAQFAQSTALTLTPTADPGSVFTGWLGPCTGTANCAFNVAATTGVTATFAPGATLPKADIDGNATFDALTDGLLILRYMFGLTGTSLTNNAVAQNGTRSTPADVQTYLTNMKPMLDVDGNGTTDALTDGLIVMRYLFGIRGAQLISNAIGTGATRTTSNVIEPYLATFLQ